MLALAITCLLSCVLLGDAAKQSHLTLFDKETLKSVFNSGFAKGFTNVQSVYLSVRGYSLLDEQFAYERDACNLFKATFLNSERIGDLYAAAHGASLLTGEKCVLDVSRAQKALGVDKMTSMENLFLATKTFHYLNIAVDVDGVKKAMDNFLKKDSSALSQAFSYYIAAQIVKDKADLGKYFAEVEDTIQQADEADGEYMYYEDGVFATGFIVNAIFELAHKYGQAPQVPMDKLTKLSSFLLSRRFTDQLKAAVELTAALRTLSTNKYAVPLVAVLSDGGVVDKSHARLSVALSTLWGDRIDGAKIVADTVKNVQSAVTVMTKTPLEYRADAGSYELDLAAARDQLSRGFYAVKLDVKLNDTRYPAVFAPTLMAKVVSAVAIDGAELAIKERDQLTGMVNYKLSWGAQLTDKLAMNWHHRLDMKFTIRDADRPVRAHQVFIKLSHAATGQEIIFVVEPDRSDVYKFSLDLDKSNKEFDNLSGDYRMELMVGDALLRTPDNWIFATVKLDMPSSPTPASDSTGESRRTVAGTKRSAVNPRIGHGPSVAKPQIFHMFKPAEKRGGQLISTIFTILCIVPPFVIMLVLWAFLGINISNFQLAISPLMFHAGLVAIFGLYYCYWSYLNMFTTLSYMIPLGSVTAFFGNRLLRQIAAKRKEV